jgi:hypothetical protein
MKERNDECLHEGWEGNEGKTRYKATADLGTACVSDVCPPLGVKTV